MEKSLLKAIATYSDNSDEFIKVITERANQLIGSLKSRLTEALNLKGVNIAFLLLEFWDDQNLELHDKFREYCGKVEEELKHLNYAIISENNQIISAYKTLPEAEEALVIIEQGDAEEGIYEPNFYKIIEL